MSLNKVFFVCTLISVSKAYLQESCKKLFKETPKIDLFLNADLFLLRQVDLHSKTLEDIAMSNGKTIKDLYSEGSSPALINGRKDYMTFKEAQDVLTSIQSSTASPLLSFNYEKQTDKIGYCFGRAMYFHIALLKNKVHKSAIKKVWIIGPMKYKQDNWNFHVATLVKLEDQKWYALDTNQTEPTEVIE